VILQYRAGRQGEDKEVGGTAERIRGERKKREKLKNKEKKYYFNL